MHEELCQLLLQIPSRKVTTYGDLSKALGSVRASRWVAMHLNQSVNPNEYPTHRVIKSTGELGTFAGGNVDLKRELLLHEKIPIQDERVDLTRYLFDEFQCDQPLVRLKKEQDKVRKKSGFQNSMGNRRPLVQLMFLTVQRMNPLPLMLWWMSGQRNWSGRERNRWNSRFPTSRVSLLIGNYRSISN